ncbi:VWA domain-containing protein [Candidatus Poribacteria bacterium]|nr:VWA domain-containing protein [Candidatus Poribacteria bacterium]
MPHRTRTRILRRPSAFCVVSTVLLLTVAVARGQHVGGSGRMADRPLARAFAQIGESIAWSTVSGQADIFIVLDTSATMMDRMVGGSNRVKATGESLEFLVQKLDQAEVDYHLRLLGFHDFYDEQALELSRWTPHPDAVRTRIADFGVMGEEQILDVLMQTLDLFQHRVTADKHLVLVCDSRAATSWEAEGAVAELQDRIRRRVLMDGIRAQIVGYDEPFQRRLATESGGVFVEMPPSPPAEARAIAPPAGRVRLEPSALDGGFASIAEHALQADASAFADGDLVLLLLDYSLSMQGRLRATLEGVAVLDAALRAAGLEPEYAVSRFGEADGTMAGGLMDTNVTRPIGLLEDLPRMFRHPAAGSEDLKAAMARGAPWAREHGARVVIAVTDEPPATKTAATVGLADAVAESGARFYAIMPLRETAARQPAPLQALVDAVVASGGAVFPMPRASYTASARR